MVGVFCFLDLCLAKQRYGQLVILGNGAKRERTPGARLLKKGLNGEKKIYCIRIYIGPCR